MPVEGVASLASRRLALVLSGGGVRAAAQIGAIRVFEEYGLIPDIIIGNSGGSIVGSLYAAGLTAQQIERVFGAYRNHPGRVVDFDYGAVVRAVFSLSLKPLKGFIRGDRLMAEMSRQLERAGVHQFDDLDRNNDRRRPLLLVGVNICNGEETVFTSTSPFWAARAVQAGVRVCPRLSLAEAVRISTAIPGVFAPFRCSHFDCPVNGTSRAYYVDGGLRDNYAIATAVRLAAATHILGINLGYAGMRRDSVVDGGVLDILGQSLDIFGQDQVEADKAYIQMTNARLITLNPLVYSVGTFDLGRIPWLISRGEAVARDFFSNINGLRPGLEHRDYNIELIFGSRQSIFVFPEPGSSAHGQWLLHQNAPAKPVPRKGQIAMRLAGLLGAGFVGTLLILRPDRIPLLVLAAAVAGATALAWRTVSVRTRGTSK